MFSVVPSHPEASVTYHCYFDILDNPQKGLLILSVYMEFQEVRRGHTSKQID